MDPATEQEQLEKAHGEAPDSDFDADYEEDSPIDTTQSEEFQEDGEKSQPEKDKGQKASDETPKETEWDKERQRADQAEANYRKTQEQLETSNSKVEQQGKQLEALEAKLNDYVKANEVNLDDLDDETVEPSVKKALKSMQAQVDAATARAEKLEQSRDDIAKELDNQATSNRKTTQQAGIISDIEEEFPAKYRNAAISAANKVCTERGYAPADRYESHKMLRAEYKKLADADKDSNSTKTDVVTDTGAGAKPVVKNEKKQTTLKDAANQWRKKLRSNK